MLEKILHISKMEKQIICIFLVSFMKVVLVKASLSFSLLCNLDHYKFQEGAVQEYMKTSHRTVDEAALGPAEGRRVQSAIQASSNETTPQELSILTYFCKLCMFSTTSFDQDIGCNKTAFIIGPPHDQVLAKTNSGTPLRGSVNA